MPDLNGLVAVQNQFLTDLNSLVTNNYITDPTNQLSIIQSTNNDINTNLLNASGSANALADHQVDMQKIVDDERSRLNDKKTQIDTALIGQQRIVSLNDSYRQRYSQYVNVIIVIVVTLALIITINIISKIFTMIPSLIFDLLIIVILSAGIYLCYTIIININSRSKIDFNKLDLQPPKVLTADEIAAAKNTASKSGNLLGTVNLNGCVGPVCCGTGTTWNDELAICKPSATQASATQASGSGAQGFSTMSVESFKTINVSYNNGPVKPISPTEFDKYYIYK